MGKNAENDLHTSIKVMRYCISTGWRVEKRFFVFRILQLIADIILPFVNLIFMPLIIDELIMNQRVELVVRYTAGLILLDVLFSRLSTYSRLQAGKYESLYNNFLEEELTGKTMEMDYELTENKVALDQLQRAKNGIEGWSGGIAGIINPLMDIIKNIIVLSGVLFILLSKGPVLVLLCILGMIVEGFINKKMIGVNTRLYKRQSLVEREFNYTLFELVDFKNAKDIRLYEAADMMMDKTEREIKRIVQIEKERVNEIQPWNVAETISYLIGQACIYIYLGIRAIKGMITIGSFTQLLEASDRLGGALVGLLNNLQGILQKASYFNEFLTFMTYPSKSEVGTREISDTEHLIEFRDVSFKYPHADRNVLEHVSIKILPGKHLSIVGLNGAGKTTFIKLLCRLYDVSEGEILLDGINIQEYDIKEYLRILSVVFQDFKLFSFSIKDNIILSGEESDEEVMRQCKLVGLDEKIQSLEKGLNTILFKDFDEEGIELSGGQQQKLAIARAIHKNAQIVIMDEPTAALDPVAEYEIYSKLDHLIGGKTAIFISHRLSSCLFCDQIAVFSEGTIKEYGTHEELVKKNNGIYAEMFMAQAKNYNLSPRT